MYITPKIESTVPNTNQTKILYLENDTLDKKQYSSTSLNTRPRIYQVCNLLYKSKDKSYNQYFVADPIIRLLYNQSFQNKICINDNYNVAWHIENNDNLRDPSIFLQSMKIEMESLQNHLICFMTIVQSKFYLWNTLFTTLISIHFLQNALPQ